MKHVTNANFCINLLYLVEGVSTGIRWRKRALYSRRERLQQPVAVKRKPLLFWNSVVLLRRRRKNLGFPFVLLCL